jgi:hypothetical protein
MVVLILMETESKIVKMLVQKLLVLAAFKGLSLITDGDGVAEALMLVQMLLVSCLKGCPDADGDGVADKDDKCPNVAGPKDNAGRPWPDTDKDGVYDKMICVQLLVLQVTRLS